jgi:choline dehydrogenase-like flavoprotein
MIQDARRIPAGTVLEYDVCIVGGGAAGISMAKALAGTSWRVLLVEAGERGETAQARDLYRGFAAPAESHEPLEENRRRQFGGTTAAWGGRCVPFDAIDFEERSWVPHSGWPLKKSELESYYARALELCEAGEYKFQSTEAFPDSQREMIAGFDGSDVVSTPLERWGPPTRFGKRYAADLQASDNVTVLLNANCLHIQLDPAGQRVEQIAVASFKRNRLIIKARHFVLTCGGLETARLLLASNDVRREGIGNHSDKLGRYYMSHLHGAVAVAQLRDNAHGFIYDFERDPEQVYCRRRFWITPPAQEKNEMLNVISFFFRPPLDREMHRNALFSTTYLAKFLLTTFTRNSPNRAAAILKEHRSALTSHLKIALKDAPGLIPQVIAIAKARYFAKRRVPMLLPPKSDNHYYLFYQSEHAPNPDSRVVLHSEKDFFGMPRLLVKVAFCDLDIQTVLRTHRLIRDQFAATKTGTLVYEEEELLDDVNKQIRRFNSSAHQLGTTRMSVNARDGVVDANCRVHGIENLFVAGGSVFPTSSHANPTLTLIALALRLADHLKHRLQE